MNVPYCVDGPSLPNSAQLARLQDGRFHVLVAGTIDRLICGPDHILANEPLASALRSLCADSLTIEPVQIVRLATGESWTSHSELLPHDEITPESLDRIDCAGLGIWHYDRRGLFVSPPLRQRLIEAGFADLEFSAGFSHWGG